MMISTMKKVAIQLTQRDIQILEFINEFGFCEMTHIAKQFTLSQPRRYQVMERLINAELVRRHVLFNHRFGVYTLTDKGAKCTDLPAMPKVPIAYYNHHLQVISVSQKLSLLYPEAQWVSERRIIIEKFFGEGRRRGHIADGLIYFPSVEKPTAIEVELTAKKRLRVEKIIKGYGGNFEIKEVWYFCTRETIKIVSAFAEKKPFIKIFDIESFLND